MRFVSRAKLHESCAHVIIVHIDWQGRVRRKYAYVCQEDAEKDIQESDLSIKNLSLDKIFDKIDNASKTS